MPVLQFHGYLCKAALAKAGAPVFYADQTVKCNFGMKLHEHKVGALVCGTHTDMYRISTLNLENKIMFIFEFSGLLTRLSQWSLSTACM